jgi:glycosyltransferase involved in cell wall biosynthesis
MNKALPLVSVLTPVYNGEKYLAECIESVLNQDYKNWEYVIVNNCSNDSSLNIASHYASMDSRIRVVSNPRFVDVIENHNIAFGYVSQNSKYCKVVSADDWIYPECITRMVQLAEENPSVAIVGAYAISRDGVNHVGLPPERSIFRGSEVCRLHLLGGPLVIGAPTSSLYRSEIVRSEDRFFPGSELRADIAACYRALEHHDFGFVHQILSFERVHAEALSAQQIRLNAFLVDRVAFLADYGRIFLTDEEFERRFDEVLKSYYQFLTSAFLNRYPETFWNYHRGRLEEIGLKIDRRRLQRAALQKIIDLLCNPKQTIEKILKRMKQRND